MLSRLARWWLDRKARQEEIPLPPPMGGECVCGRTVYGEDWHLVVAVASDDAALGMETADGAGTAMSADFCPDHCPGGCRLGCVPSEA